MLELPFPVAPRIAIDQRFATRDLVRGVARNPRYRVLALGEKPTRLFEGQGSVLVECRTGGFPCFVEGARGEPLESGGFPTHTSRTAEQHRAFFRDVDRALDVATKDEALPLVVGGTQRDLAYFDSVTTHGATVLGHVEGNYEDAGPAELARRAQPLIDAGVRGGARQRSPNSSKPSAPAEHWWASSPRGMPPVPDGAGSAGGGRLRVSGP